MANDGFDLKRDMGCFGKIAAYYIGIPAVIVGGILTLKHFYPDPPPKETDLQKIMANMPLPTREELERVKVEDEEESNEDDREFETDNMGNHEIR